MFDQLGQVLVVQRQGASLGVAEPAQQLRPGPMPLRCAKETNGQWCDLTDQMRILCARR